MSNAKRNVPAGRELVDNEKLSPLGRELAEGFSPQLSWSHYRALIESAQGEREHE